MSIHTMTTDNQAAPGALTDEQIDKFIPTPVIQDTRGRGFGGEGSWSRFQVRETVRAALAAQQDGGAQFDVGDGDLTAAYMAGFERGRGLAQRAEEQPAEHSKPTQNAEATSNWFEKLPTYHPVRLEFGVTMHRDVSIQENGWIRRSELMGTTEAPEPAEPAHPQSAGQPTNRQDAVGGNENAIRHIAYAEGYAAGKLAASQIASAPVLTALTELVVVKTLKDETEALHFAGVSSKHGENWESVYKAQRAEYLRRQPAAWDAARAALVVTPRPAAQSAPVEEWERALTAVMPADFKDWHEGSRREWPELAAGVILNLRKSDAAAWDAAGKMAEKIKQYESATQSAEPVAWMSLRFTNSPAQVTLSWAEASNWRRAGGDVRPLVFQSAEQSGVPEGWKLVPITPTEAMCRAAVVFANGEGVYGGSFPRNALAIEESIYGEIYADMLAAAPKEPNPALAFPVGWTPEQIEAAALAEVKKEPKP